MDSSVIIAIIAEQLGIDEKDINENTSFADLGADSLDLFQIISALEEEFDIEFPNSALNKFKTVGDIVKFLEKNT